MIGEGWLKLVSGVAIGAVFAAGMLVGAGVMRHRADAPRPPVVTGAIREIETQLGLDTDQVEQLRRIERRHDGEVEAIGREIQPRLRAILFAIEDELRPSLSPAQIGALDEWRRTRRAPGGAP